MLPEIVFCPVAYLSLCLVNTSVPRTMSLSVRRSTCHCCETFSIDAQHEQLDQHTCKQHCTTAPTQCLSAFHRLFRPETYTQLYANLTPYQPPNPTPFSPCLSVRLPLSRRQNAFLLMCAAYRITAAFEKKQTYIRIENSILRQHNSTHPLRFGHTMRQLLTCRQTPTLRLTSLFNLHGQLIHRASVCLLSVSSLVLLSTHSLTNINCPSRLSPTLPASKFISVPSQSFISKYFNLLYAAESAKPKPPKKRKKPSGLRADLFNKMRKNFTPLLIASLSPENRLIL